MSDEEIFEELRSLCVSLLDADPAALSPATDLRRDLEADSLDLAELVTAAEVRFGHPFDFDLALRMQTLADAVTLVRATVDRGRSAQPG
ncbi:acyl carrier protein [Nonomuraea sp. NPDC049400]|uniref:acyl carrier protein n=1 Tax=Nonomuraea sp. NPDC049400 TaxID=3364352 RepID=UPI0037AECCCF